MQLSKTKYCDGLFCPKFLWMNHNMPEQKADQDDTRAKIGNMVGNLARDYFGDYVEVKSNHRNISEMIAQTKQLLEAGAWIIAEATFSLNNNLCMVDILRKTDKGYDIIEVKSSTGSPGDSPGDINPRHLDDMAYQYYVVSNSGLAINKVSLMQINRKYTRYGELNLQELFTFVDCTESILQMQEEVPGNIETLTSVTTKEDEPELPVGDRCKDCGYRAWCFRDMPKNNVFDIGWRMWGSKKDEAYQSGIVTFEDVLNRSIKLSQMQLRQVRTVVDNLPPHVEPQGIRQFLETLSYPLYYLDFETYQQVVPLWDGVRPYQQIPFQYSLHVQHASCAKPIHKEFLGKEGTDPRRALAERLCADIPKNVCVLAYNMSFEKSQIKGLAELFPDLSEHLMNIHSNIKDLMIPFAKGYYYHREMGGSYSIKGVLPALCGGDPELDYSSLKLIQHGGDVMALYPTLHEQPPEEIAKIRKALLAYCKLDTLAMVKILEKLYEVT